MIFLIEPFFQHDQNSRKKKLNISRKKRAFKMKQKAFSIIFNRFSVVKNFLRPESASLNMTGNFHKIIDGDCLDLPGSEGDCGLKSIQIPYECRLLSLNHHPAKNTDRNQLLLFTFQTEENESERVACERRSKHNSIISKNETPRRVGQKYLKSRKKRASS